jgi:hypothetical protein
MEVMPEESLCSGTGVDAESCTNCILAQGLSDIVDNAYSTAAIKGGARKDEKRNKADTVRHLFIVIARLYSKIHSDYEAELGSQRNPKDETCGCKTPIFWSSYDLGGIDMAQRIVAKFPEHCSTVEMCGMGLFVERRWGKWNELKGILNRSLEGELSSMLQTHGADPAQTREVAEASVLANDTVAAAYIWNLISVHFALDCKAGKPAIACLPVPLPGKPPDPTLMCRTFNHLEGRVLSSLGVPVYVLGYQACSRGVGRDFVVYDSSAVTTRSEPLDHGLTADRGHRQRRRRSVGGLATPSFVLSRALQQPTWESFMKLVTTCTRPLGPHHFDAFKDICMRSQKECLGDGPTPVPPSEDELEEMREQCPDQTVTVCHSNTPADSPRTAAFLPPFSNQHPPSPTSSLTSTVTSPSTATRTTNTSPADSPTGSTTSSTDVLPLISLLPSQPYPLKKPSSPPPDEEKRGRKMRPQTSLRSTLPRLRSAWPLAPLPGSK